MKKAIGIAISVICIVAVVVTLACVASVFILPRRDLACVRDYALPGGISLADAIVNRTQGCTNVMWDANDLGVFAEAQTLEGVVLYKFCVERGKVAAASGRTEQVLPEISLGIGWTNDTFFHPFMMAYDKRMKENSEPESGHVRK